MREQQATRIPQELPRDQEGLLGRSLFNCLHLNPLIQRHPESPLERHYYFAVHVIIYLCYDDWL